MDEYGAAVRSTIDDDRAVAGHAALSMEDDADQAAKSMELSDLTGVPAPIIHNDFENFHRETTTDFATRLVKNNPHLQDYIKSHPMAAKVSNDDWGQLDKISELLGKRTQVETEPHPIWGAIPDIIDVWKEFGKSIVEAPGQIINTGQEDITSTQMYKDVYKSLLGHGLDPARAAREAVHQAETFQRGTGLLSLITGPAMVAGAPAAIGGPAVAAAGLGGFLMSLGLFRHNIAKPIEKETGFPSESTEQALMVLAGFAGIKGLKDFGDKAKHQEVIDHLQQVHDAVAPFVEAGEPPPVGVHPTVDKFLIDQAKQDKDIVSEQFKEVQKSSTLGRSPELTQKFIELKEQLMASPAFSLLRLGDSTASKPFLPVRS